MSESEQQRKYRISLAGELLVAGELLRRGVTAAVTYGNAKKADVIAVFGNRAISIEVKTTQKDKWVVGGQTPPASDDIWVFVYLPEDGRKPPKFCVLTAAEMHPILNARDLAYQERYRRKHGVEYSARGVVSLPRSAVEAYEGKWDKVQAALIAEKKGGIAAALPHV